MIPRVRPEVAGLSRRALWFMECAAVAGVALYSFALGVLVGWLCSRG